MQKHIIEIDWNSLPLDLNPFVNHTVSLANAHGVQLRLEKTKLVKVCEDGDSAHGFFDEHPTPHLVVACDYSYEDWFPIYMHESCHMDQWIEHSSIWKERIIQNTAVETIFDLWVANAIELSLDQRKKYAHIIRRVELDCERRTVAKMAQWHMPFDVQKYTQQANAYVWYYSVLERLRVWPFEKSPSDMEEIWTKMPTHLNHEADQIPDEILAVYKSVIPAL